MALPDLLADEDALRERYHGEGATLEEIGRELGVHANTVGQIMELHEIPRRDPPKWADGGGPQYPELHDREWLRRKRRDELMSVRRIAEETGASPNYVRERLRHYGITVPEGERVS